MNGDAIFDVNHDLENSYYGVSQVFVYIFVSLSTLVILNVFIISKYKIIACFYFIL